MRCAWTLQPLPLKICQALHGPVLPVEAATW